MRDLQADPALFFHSRFALKDRLSLEEKKEDADASLIADLSVALQYVEEQHGSNITSLGNLLPAKEITWSLLWALFTPNCMMYHFHYYTEQPQVLIMRRIRQRYRKDGTPFWHVMCDMIADDGLKFGYTKDLGIASRPDLNSDLEIDQYDGARSIQDLIVYPLEYAPNPAQIRKDVIERGKKYARMIGNTYWETSGPAMRETMNDRYEVNRSRFSTHGRTMIDTASFRASNPKWSCSPTVQSTLDRTQLTDDQHLICAPFVGGFGFGDKKWGGFAVSRLQQVNFSDEPFHSLVIGPKQKTLIHSLVKQHSSKGTGYDDVIQGKGLGLIGLLSGRPGCGKTLTAEALAEVTKRPLYAVSAGELGTEVEKVEKQLNLILELSHRWSAVLLLDEADVFLQERDTKDVARNALVSIFLRQLEYFQGILILTTNRIGDCDPAFESKSLLSSNSHQTKPLTTAFAGRIHFSIHYPDLDLPARCTIWKQFISRAGGRLTGPEILKLGQRIMNGRQVRFGLYP